MLASDALDEQLTALFGVDPETLKDPYAIYRRLREESPVHRYGDAMVIVARHRDVKAVFADPETFPQPEARSAHFDDKFALLSDEEVGLYREIVAFERLFVSRRNGADHRRVRGAAQRAFTPKRIAELRPLVEGLVDELLAPMTDETVDFIQFAYRLPLLVIMALLDVPREDADRVKEWGDAVSAPGGRNPMEPDTVRTAHRGLNEYRAYTRELIERHRREPGRTDLVAALLDAEEGERITEDELVAMFMHFLFAGHETTTNLFGNGLLALMRHRDEWERLCAQPELAITAVDELLRYDSPLQFFSKEAGRDLEIDGVAVEKGTTVMLGIGAANRDSDVYGDGEALDVARRPNDHMTLGYGMHFCVGGPLARLEGQIVLSTLARRFPDLELAVDPADLVYNPHSRLRGLRALPVHLGRDRGIAS